VRARVVQPIFTPSSDVVVNLAVQFGALHPDRQQSDARRRTATVDFRTLEMRVVGNAKNMSYSLNKSNQTSDDRD
jgi:hypothetical protein